MSEDKRKRSPNWLLSEKELLISLVELHLTLIENKQMDGVTIKTKLAQWQIIADQYNSRTTHCSRTVENLKTQWENLKKIARKDEANNRKLMTLTGGGPANPKMESPLHHKVISLIGTSAVGVSKTFDSDSVASIGSESDNWNADVKVVLHEEQALSSEDSMKNHDDNQSTEVSDEIVIEQDWSDYSPQMLRTLSDPLQGNIIDKEQGAKRKDKSFISRRRPKHTASPSTLKKFYRKKFVAIDYQKSLAEKEALNLNEAHELDLQIKREQLKQEKLKTRLMILDLRIKQEELLKK